MAIKIILLVIILILLVFDYVLVVIAHKADKKAERMYKAWREALDGIGDCVICKYVGTDKCDACVCGTEWERRKEKR